MWIGTPGCFGFLGVANLLSGQAIPSGHLADTYAVDTAKSAAAQNYGIILFRMRQTLIPPIIPIWSYGPIGIWLRQKEFT